MNKINELQTALKEALEKATSKEEIEMLSKLNTKVEEVQQEQTAFEQEHTNLLKDYKEIIVHTNFKEAPKSPTEPTQTTFDADKFIKEELNKIKEKGN